jgi:hypothetical protein
VGHDPWLSDSGVKVLGARAVVVAVIDGSVGHDVEKKELVASGGSDRGLAPNAVSG